MSEILKILVNIINNFHDLLIALSEQLGFQLNDKDLHFWVFGIFGIFFFVFTFFIFKWISRWKWSITSISFIYTFTILIILAFAIEIQQKITNRGNMEFQDAAMGLWGFLAFFGVYILFKFIFISVLKFFKKNNYKETFRETDDIFISEDLDKKD